MKHIIAKLKTKHLIHLLPLLSLICSQLSNFWGLLPSVYFSVFFFWMWLWFVLDKRIIKFMMRLAFLRLVSIFGIIAGIRYVSKGIKIGNTNILFIGIAFCFSSICLLIADLIRNNLTKKKEENNEQD